MQCLLLVRCSRAKTLLSPVVLRCPASGAWSRHIVSLVTLLSSSHVSVSIVSSIYLSTKAFTQASLLTRSLNQLYPAEFRVAKCRISNLSYLGAAPDSLHPSTHHPPEAGQRVSRPVDSGQWTVWTFGTLLWTGTPE